MKYVWISNSHYEQTQLWRTKDVSTIRSDTLRFLKEMIEDTHQGRKIKELPGNAPIT